MLTEDWVELIKNVLSPSAFRDVGMAALRVLYGVRVTPTDGAGDGGVDAWVELPSGRVPAQFYAGRTEPWEAKLGRDLATHALLASNGRLYFLCASTPAVEWRQASIRRDKLEALERAHNVRIHMLDARAIATTAGDAEVLEQLCRFAGIPRAARPQRE